MALLLLRAACLAALAPVAQASYNKPCIYLQRPDAAFAVLPLQLANNSPTTVRGVKRGWNRGTQQCATTADLPLPRRYPPFSDHGYLKARHHRPGCGCLSMVETKTSSEEAGAQTGFTSISSPAAERLADKGMNHDSWEALLGAGEVFSLREGELLISLGDSFDEPEDREVYLLLSGECQLEVRDNPTGKLLPGDFVGEASFTSGRQAPRTATVRAKNGGATAVLWTWRDLRAFMAKNQGAKAALEACWMLGLAEKLSDVMSALGGQSVVQSEEEVEAGDYGFRYLEDAKEVESIVPLSAATLAGWSFAREYRSLRRTFRFGEFKNTWISGPFSTIDRFLEKFIFPVLRPSRVDLPRDPEKIDLQARLADLKLSNKAIADREDTRIAATQALLRDENLKGLREAGYILRSQTPWFVMLPYKVLCWLLDVIFEDRPIQRFWFLETVARMPYFSYLSMLFFYETIGWWSGGSEVRKIHFAEEYNEMMHLRIMESLGGDTRWSDRFFARHSSFVYFWVLILAYMVSPFLAYNFSELIESHAVDTYSEFLEANSELLKSLPPTPQALAYYRGGDMYLFDEFQTSRPAFSRRPIIKNLYDVFMAIRDDELEHVKTMFACERGKGNLMSPNEAAALPRWAEDSRADSPSEARGSAPTGATNNKVTGGEVDNLRTDVLTKSPLEAFYARFNPLRKAMYGEDKKESRGGGSGEDAGGEPASETAAGEKGDDG